MNKYLQDLKFIEETHQYYLHDKELISCTRMLQKYGLAPDYSTVDTKVLEAKAEWGKQVHKALEEWIKYGRESDRPEVNEFIKEMTRRGITRDMLHSESLVNNDVAAGSIDLWYVEGLTLHLIDFKTTYTIHRESVSWQLSIYERLGYDCCEFNSELEDGSMIVDSVHEVFHFDKKGNMDIVVVPNISESLVAHLIDAERNGTQFNLPQIFTENKISELESIEYLITSLEEQKKQAEAKEKEMKDALLAAMKEYGITTYDFGLVKATLKASYTRESVDTAALKKDGLYDKYKKTSTVKESLLLTIKKERGE